jgi:hypothetical protein
MAIVFAAAIVAGITTPVLAGALNPDAELLAAAAEFDLVGKWLRWINDAIPGPELSEAECNAALDRFYELLAKETQRRRRQHAFQALLPSTTISPFLNQIAGIARCLLGLRGQVAKPGDGVGQHLFA